MGLNTNTVMSLCVGRSRAAVKVVLPLRDNVERCAHDEFLLEMGILVVVCSGSN